MKLRPYQQRAVEWVLRKAVENPSARLLIVLPMGGGKTAIAAALLRVMVAHQADMRGLFVAHRVELLAQARAAILAADVYKGLVAPLGEPSPKARIIIGGVDSLCRAGVDSLPSADLVITDEAHRDAGPFRRKLRSAYPDALRVGFTATPERLDGRALREDYDDMLVAAQPSELIADGHLVAPRVFTVPADRLPDLRGVRLERGEFSASEVERRTNTIAILGDIVSHWKRMAQNRRTLVFAVSRAHSLAIVERLKRAGVAAAHLDGHVKGDARKATLDALARGELRVISSCEVLAEGLDLPAVKCVVMARPTASLVVSNQQAGRCMRPWTSAGEPMGAIILDHAGNIMRHGYPHADREWSLDGFKARARNTNMRQPLRACARCHAVIPPDAPCSECGAEVPPPPNTPSPRASAPEPIEIPGDLVALSDSLPLSVRQTEYERLRAFAAQKGYEQAWADRVYRAKFGEARAR